MSESVERFEESLMKNIPIFDGGPSGSTLSNFLWKIELVAELSHWSEETMILIAKIKMGGLPAKNLKDKPLFQQVSTNWEEFKRQLGSLGNYY